MNDVPSGSFVSRLKKSSGKKPRGSKQVSSDGPDVGGRQQQRMGMDELDEDEEEDVDEAEYGFGNGMRNLPLR